MSKSIETNKYNLQMYDEHFMPYDDGMHYFSSVKKIKNIPCSYIVTKIFPNLEIYKIMQREDKHNINYSSLVNNLSNMGCLLVNIFFIFLYI